MSESRGWGKPLCTPPGMFTVLDPILKAQGEKKKRQATMTEGKRTITVQVHCGEPPELVGILAIMDEDEVDILPCSVHGWLLQNVFNFRVDEWTGERRYEGAHIEDVKGYILLSDIEEAIRELEGTNRDTD